MKKKKAEKIIDAVGFPKDAVLSLPTITISLGSEVSIVNYGGIIDYDENFISLPWHYLNRCRKALIFHDK